MTLPHLSSSAIRQALGKFERHQRTFIAIYGTGESDRVILDGKGTVEIVPVRSELELREKLPPLGSSPYRAFLVPFSGVLPEDIAGRFTSNGKIERVGRDQQLAGLVGAAFATPEAANLELAAWVLRPGHPTKSYAFSGQRLDVDELFELWLSNDWGLPTGALALDTLLAWAVRDGRGREFERTLNGDTGSRVMDELRAHLDKKVGPLGPVLLRAWIEGTALRLLGFGLLAEALVDSGDSAMDMWLRQVLKNVASVSVNADTLSLARTLGALVRPVIAWLERRGERQVVERAFSEAEGLIDTPEVRANLVASSRLPLAWTLRLERLNAALLGVSERRDRAALKDADEAWRSLENHDFFQREDQTPLIRRAQMALRLASWLVHRPDQDLLVPDHSYGVLEALSAWYAESGGFLDWARRSARALTVGPLAVGVRTLLEPVDRERLELDRRFSESLAHWIHAGRPSPNLLPIDRALERVAARFLQESNDRTLLVLLMDGMAWAQAVELLESMAQDGRRWGPIAWSEGPQNRIGPGRYPPMIAALPTITEVSRAAFFAGVVPKSGSTLNAAKDPDLFGAHKAMQRFVEPHLRPKLMLRGDGHTSSGALTEEARQMILATKEQRVCAIVINAIDSSLKGDSQHEHPWTVDSIRSLPQILDEARAAGRHILMAADHGYVPADLLQSVGAIHGGGARYRRWTGAGDSLLPGERKFSGEGVYVQKGDEAVVLLEHDAARYGGGAHAGEHGGASLAEVVAPCVLLGWDDQLTREQDRDLKVRAFFSPDWWNRVVVDEAKSTIERTESAPKRKKKADPPENQTSFAGLDPVAPPPSSSRLRPPRPPKASELLPSLAGSEMLKARAPDAAVRESVVQAVHFLLARPGGAPAGAFASELGIPVFRVSGHVTKLQEVLNLDGYEIIRLDRTHQQIFLDRVKLEQQFEIKL